MNQMTDLGTQFFKGETNFPISTNAFLLGRVQIDAIVLSVCIMTKL